MKNRNVSDCRGHELANINILTQLFKFEQTRDGWDTWWVRTILIPSIICPLVPVKWDGENSWRFLKLCLISEKKTKLKFLVP